MFEISTKGEAETREVAARLGKSLSQKRVIAFFGDLGAGKTTFIKGLVTALTGLPETEVSSPTYVYLNSYEGSQTVHHFDLYRLKGAEQFLGMGFDDYFFSEEICCIEWAERIEEILPKNVIKVVIEQQGEGRVIKITPFDGMEENV